MDGGYIVTVWAMYGRDMLDVCRVEIKVMLIILSDYNLPKLRCNFQNLTSDSVEVVNLDN